MYTRIMAVVLAVVLALTVSLSSVCFVSLRNQQADARLEALKSEAREIAWLAAQNTSTVFYLSTAADGISEVLSWKASSVYDDYGAYILVVDRRGRVMDNSATAYEANPEFIESLDGEELSAALETILSGEEVTVRAMVSGSPTFTVGVPFVQSGVVLGAVLIQTPAQTIEVVDAALIWKIVGIALLALALAGGILLVLVRRTMRPLHRLTDAARTMSGGDFSVRVPEDGTVPETRELSATFNMMAEKLDELETSRREFVANVSHELRSPITSIRGFAEGMAEGVIPPEEHPKYLAIVAEETRRLSRLISDLLALSRLERKDAQLTLTTFDITELLRRCVIRRVNDLEQRRMEVDCRFPEEAVQVLADSDRIEQVAANLLDNAIKFTPEGGKITWSVVVEDGRVTVTITDTGCGIPPEDRSRVFERFFTADRAHTSGNGTGLGLSICQRIMEMHGERISLLDTREGTAFAFTLKAAENPHLAQSTKV